MSNETMTRLQVGINYPWIDYAWDFGIPPSAWVDPEIVDQWRARKRDQIVKDFRSFADLGLFAVRWFMLADGLSYGTGPEAPQLVDGKWRFDPLPREHPFHRQFCDDFEFVLKVCSETGIRFVPSLIDFHWCHQATLIDPAAGIVKGGRGDILRDSDKLERFLDNVLEPLLDVSIRYPEAIYAWELINEPEWVTKRRLFCLLQRSKPIPYSSMIDFITKGAGRINRRLLPDGGRAFRSSVGFAHWDAMKMWDMDALGITAPQFHYYAPDHREIPLNGYPEDTPCFIGEFATTCLRCWPDLSKNDTERPIPARLQNIEEKGYPAAFLWSARAHDNATTWEPSDHQDTLAFLKPSPDRRGDVIA